MSIKSNLSSLWDDALETVFNKKEVSPEKARARAKKFNDTARQQFGKIEPIRGRKSWSANNSVIKFTPTAPIENKETLWIPSERFAEFLAKYDAEIDQGIHDKALLAADSDGPRPSVQKKARKERTPEEKAATAAKRAATFAERGIKPGRKPNAPPAAGGSDEADSDAEPANVPATRGRKKLTVA